MCISCKGKNVLYFDSFSIPPPVEFVEYAGEKQIIYNYGHPIQDILSVRCGYCCLYFLNKISKGKSFYDVLKVFSLKDPSKNEKFIKEYFLNKRSLTVSNKESKRNALNLPDFKLQKIGERFFGLLAQNAEFGNLNLLKIRETNSAGPRNRLFRY